MMISELKEPAKPKQDVPGNETSKPGKLLRCPQEGCGKVFRSSPGYRYHLKSHDIDPRPHVCHVCHKKFKSANGLKYHLRKAHHIEPVASKQNLNGNNASSPKDRESLSSEEDHLYNNNLSDSYSRGYINGAGGTGGSYQDRTSNIPPSPLVKSPLGGLNSPLIKNLPPISPLIKSPLDIGPYLSSSSAGSALQSPFPGKDRYTQFYDKRNGDFARSSLSEYTQQCQQQTNQFRQQCQRLSTGDLSNPRLPSIDFASQRPCDYFNRRPDVYNSSIGGYHHDYNNQKSDELQYTSLNDVKGPITSAKDCRLFSPYKEFAPNEGKEYPGGDLVPNHNLHCAASCSINTNNCNFQNTTADLHGYSNTLNLPGPVQHKTQCSLQNTEQIVPDISSPGCQLSPPTYDRNNNNSKRGASESSVETEFSDSVFQNENSNHRMSPAPPVSSHALTPVLPSPDIIKNIKTESDTTDPTFPASSVESMLHSPKSLLIRRTSRSKSIPPALVINPNPSETKTKEITKKESNSKLRQLAEIVSASPRSPYSHSPLPTLTPSILAGEGSADWGLKSPSSKFSFPAEKNFLLTPTVSRSLGLPEASSTTTEATPVSTVTSTGHSLPQSPFLDNIQTPSFWPSQMWPTPVWLCFLKGCNVKFEQDDKEFMTSEEVADFCTTPGGRKRDNMNFYTSGMKIVGMKTEQIVNSAREIVELTFEQIIPGTQRLVAKCPIDHPFYVKHRGWAAFMPTEAMARYGVPFRALAINDHVILSPSSNKMVPTPGSTLSPLVKSSGAQVFTFNINETKMFTQSSKTKTEPGTFSVPKVPSSNNLSIPPPFSMATTSSSTSTNTVKNENKSKSSVASTSSAMETITLTFSSKSDNKNNNRTQKLVDDYKSLRSAMKERIEKTSGSPREIDIGSNKSSSPDSDTSLTSITSPQSVSGDGPLSIGMGGNQSRKKRRKPLAGNEKDRRPMNGFMLFAKSMRVELTKEFPGKDNRAISKLLGERWRELSEDKREEYARMAKEMADERMKVNPDCWKRKHKKDKEIGQPGIPGAPPKPEQGSFLNNNNNNNNNNEETETGPPDAKHIKIEVEDDYSPYADLPSQENSQSNG